MSTFAVSNKSHLLQNQPCSLAPGNRPPVWFFMHTFVFNTHFFHACFWSYRTDIDECSTDQHNCIGSTCENIPGSFMCHCNLKFTRKTATTCEGGCLFCNLLPHVLNQIHYASQVVRNVKPHHRVSNQGPSANRADALTTSLWCSSHPHRRKHDISPTYMHLLAAHTAQLGLRPQTMVGSAIFVVKQTAELANIGLKETDSQSVVGASTQ